MHLTKYHQSALTLEKAASEASDINNARRSNSMTMSSIGMKSI